MKSKGSREVYLGVGIHIRIRPSNILTEEELLHTLLHKSTDVHVIRAAKTPSSSGMVSQ
jgi:hypothetical protein